MKVFVIPSWHPTPGKPLWCNWIVPHISALRAAGIEAFVLQLGLDDEEIPLGSDPWELPVRQLSESHIYVPVPRPTTRLQRSRFFYAWFLRGYFSRIVDLYKLAVKNWGKPDILHAHVSLPAGFIAAQLSKSVGVPAVVQEHYSGFESDARFFWRPGCFVKQMRPSIGGFYAVSAGFARRIEKTGLLKVDGVLPNPIDTQLFRPLTGREPQPQFRIVSAGQMGRIKGTDLLFSALQAVGNQINWHLTLFCDNLQEGRYARWLDSTGSRSRVSLPGRVPKQDLATSFASSDLYVVSSRSETANVSMLEAIACGIPVVATSCGGPETLINEQVGIVVEPESPRALAKAILRIAVTREVYCPKILHSFVVDRYSLKAVGGLVRSEYEKVLNSTKT